MVIVEVETVIDAPIERCFDLARSLSTHESTTARTRERVVSRHEDDLLEFGDIVTFEATHLRIRQRLTSKIIEFDRPNMFSDQMISGAFRSLKHIHRFESLEGGQSKMTDTLEFESPLGPLGRLFDRLFLSKYMERFIREKGMALKRIAEAERSAT